MTLHWWMHWFWVTAQFIVILGNPLPSTTTEPRGRAQDHLETETPSEIESIGTESPYDTELSTIRQQSFRIAKAIGLYPPTNTAVMLERQITTSASPLDHAVMSTEAGTLAIAGSNQQGTLNGTLAANNVASYRNRASMSQRTTGPEVVERIRPSVAKKDSKITWIDTSDKTRSKYSNQDEMLKQQQQQQQQQQEVVENATEVEDLTVLPLQEEGSKFRLVLNRTRASSSFLSSSSSLSASSSAAGKVGIRTFNRSEDDVVVDEELVEPRPLATAASILEVGVSRTRSAFPRDFQRDQVQGPSSDYTGNSSDGGEEYGSSRSAVDIAAITGSCLATVVLLSTMGSLGFIMYRRRYLNPPQTLNSDKCSNPDSSGYIDDSTIRDNSEEMYSLDNDSFLNSLEAMTIQNYWTDSVKHTKL